MLCLLSAPSLRRTTPDAFPGKYAIFHLVSIFWAYSHLYRPQPLAGCYPNLVHLRAMGGWAFVGPTLIVSDPPTTHGIGYRGSNRKSRVTTDSLDRRNCFCRARPNLESFSPTRPRYWHSLLVLCPGLVRNTASLPDYGEAKLTRASTHAFESYSVFSRGSEMIACLSTGQSS